MKCHQYSTLGHYFNIMMPVKKSDFDKKQVIESFSNEECDKNSKKFCNNIGAKKCVIGVNDRPLCEVGEPHQYQQNMLNKM